MNDRKNPYKSARSTKVVIAKESKAARFYSQPSNTFDFMGLGWETSGMKEGKLMADTQKKEPLREAAAQKISYEGILPRGSRPVNRPSIAETEVMKLCDLLFRPRR